MQVYKAFFKIIRKNLTEILIYVFIFLFFAITMSSTEGNNLSSGFEETKRDVVFISNDKESKIIDGLKEHISEKADIVDMEDDSEKLQDALFFRKIDYIIRVPEGFSDNLFAGKEVQLEKTTVPNSTTAIYVDSIVNKYLNTASVYIKNLTGASEDEIVSNIKKDLANQTQVTVNTFNTKVASEQKYVYYFNYMAYSIFAVLILGVCAVMLVYNKTDLKRRNYCSPIKSRSINLQLLFGNLTFALITWVVMIFASFILYTEQMLSVTGLLFLLNSLVLTITVLSISFLLSSIIKSRNAMSAAANVVALGCSFISGVFVPQEMLGKTVLNIASFTPTYWYIKANTAIAETVEFSMKNLTPIFNSMLIVLAFAVAAIAVALLIMKQKRTSAA
jgi:ABC-2 type transport system permease protein